MTKTAEVTRCERCLSANDLRHTYWFQVLCAACVAIVVQQMDDEQSWPAYPHGDE